MKITEILDKYSDAAIYQIAADKIDESANLRLPRSVIIQEISSALNSLSFVASALAPSRPPTYAFIKLLLESPDYKQPIEGFQEKVMQTTKDMTKRAESGNGLSPDKNYKFYINILKNAWESNNEIDRSEAQLLEAIRNELNIWTREHLLLEHHPEVRQLWDKSDAYINARNYLLLKGLVLTYENYYIIAEEVAIQIRKAWEVDLERDDYERFLYMLKNKQLHDSLEMIGLQVSGTKEEKIDRILSSLIPPTELLEYIPINELREFCRNNSIQISGRKPEVISNCIDFFDRKLDLVEEVEEETISPLPSTPETRELSNEILRKLLQNLNNDQLSDVLSGCYLKTSGVKQEKIERLIDSPWSDRTILNHLRKSDLSSICKKMAINISGVKTELIDRLIDSARMWYSMSTAKAVIENQDTKIEAKGTETKEESIDVGNIENEMRVDLPKNIQDIKADYPNLSEDEQIIMSLIKETKSLTEHDIERASKNHGLSWFLTKAQMLEIISKLKEENKNPLNVRSVGSINIYEWIGERQFKQEISEKQSARDVVDALRQGVVPNKNIDLINIGNNKEKDHLKELLNEAKNNKSPFKFIKGPYGSGKTFLSLWLREYALNNEFTVATVNIGPDQPLSDLPIFYSGLINGLRIPEKTDACALADILESWLLNIHRKTAQIEGLTNFDSSTHKKLSEIVEERVESELAHISELDPGFGPALRTFYRAKRKKDPVLASTTIAWLSGSRSMPTKMLNEIGVHGYLEANQVFPRIRALLEVIKGSRYNGIALIVDELELIRKFPHSNQRDRALEILRLLIDESGQNGMPGCLLIFTGTDTFFEDDRAGLKSYEALADRVTVPNSHEGLSSIKQPVISLKGLNHTKLMKMISKVRDIHGIAYNWDSINRFPDTALNKLVNDWTAFGESSVNRKPRPIIREFINLLDLCEENPNISYEEIIKMDVQQNEFETNINGILNQ